MVVGTTPADVTQPTPLAAAPSTRLVVVVEDLRPRPYSLDDAWVGPLLTYLLRSDLDQLMEIDIRERPPRTRAGAPASSPTT